MTPLARFVNTRILFTLPGQRGGAETGFRVSPGGLVLAWGSLSQPKPTHREHLQRIHSVDANLDILSGYLVGWAPVDSLVDWKAVPLAGLPNANTTGLRHPALLPGVRIEINNPPRFSVNAEIIESAGTYGDEGIGALTRSRIGDKLVVKVNWLA